MEKKKKKGFQRGKKRVVYYRPDKRVQIARVVRRECMENVPAVFCDAVTEWAMYSVFPKLKGSPDDDVRRKSVVDSFFIYLYPMMYEFNNIDNVLE